jgi:hypothetical protein
MESGSNKNILMFSKKRMEKKPKNTYTCPEGAKKNNASCITWAQFHYHHPPSLKMKEVTHVQLLVHAF